MSVHGEYARALRGVGERLAECEELVGDDWGDALDAARLTPQRDLSNAARAALALLQRVEAELESADAGRGSAVPPAIRRARLESLRDACHHLRAHCRAILGVIPGDR